MMLMMMFPLDAVDHCRVVNLVRPSQVCYSKSIRIGLQQIARNVEHRAVCLRQLRLVVFISLSYSYIFIHNTLLLNHNVVT